MYPPLRIRETPQLGDAQAAMALLDLFSKRQRRAQAVAPDVYRYDTLPRRLRVQIVHILRDALGHDATFAASQSEKAYDLLHDAVAREIGVFQLGDGYTARDRLIDFILKHENVEEVLDAVELGFRFVNSLGSDRNYVSAARPLQKPGQAIDELNARFKENGIGYQFEDGLILRMDSTFVHAEVIKPALTVLSDPLYAGAEKEFQSAHEHYRNGRFEETIADSLKAMESTLKTICSFRNWSHSDNDSVKNLLDVVFQRGLISTQLQSQFSALRGLLESGLPTIRNKQGGHGAGTVPRDVPSHVAGYAMNLAAVNILFLAKANELLP